MSQELKRYNAWIGYDGEAEMVEVQNGLHVLYEDFAALQAREQNLERTNAALLGALKLYRAKHKECCDLTEHPDALSSQRKDWRCSACVVADEYLAPEPIAEAESLETQKENGNG